MKKWWKDPKRKKEVANKISATLKKKLRGDYSSLPLWRSCRYTLEYRRWKKTVLDRDNYKCQECGLQDNKRRKIKSVEAHHIIPVYQIIFDNKLTTIKKIKKNKLFNDVTNGVVLCKTCHRKKHPHQNASLSSSHVTSRVP